MKSNINQKDKEISATRKAFSVSLGVHPLGNWRRRMNMAKQDLEGLRHTASHILAQAVQKLFPKVKLGIGPVIETGFYYDFDNISLKEADLVKIEKEMHSIIHRNLPMKKTLLTKAAAKNLFKGQKYKLELIDGIKDKKVGVYYTGDEWFDLCSGPHASSTSDVKAFKLLNISSSYWKGDQKNPSLQRIYGTAFYNPKELRQFLHRIEEAKKRDHKKLGKQLKLFQFEQTAPGMAYWFPKGVELYVQLINYWREFMKKEGFKETMTPQLNSSELWKTSGHWSHYKDDMFIVKMDNDELYGLKAMNCPNAITMYKMDSHSYRDLPLRLSDKDILFRNEPTGTLNGLFRIRQFSQDDAHIFCTDEQIEEEVSRNLRLCNRIYKVFGLKPKFYFATMPDKAIGSKKVWDAAEKKLASALKKNKLNYELKEKDGAFYGPKIDIHMEDSLGREWQMGTIQLDFNQPERFKLEYVTESGKKKMPAMIHRVVLGSFERFIGILVEHYAGAFPAWLAPVQVKLITFTDRNLKYAKKVEDELINSGLRVESDYRNETVQAKVRDAEMEKIPYILVVGDKEETANTVAVRPRGGKPKFGVKVGDFVKDTLKEIEDKTLN